MPTSDRDCMLIVVIVSFIAAIFAHLFETYAEKYANHKIYRKDYRVLIRNRNVCFCIVIGFALLQIALYCTSSNV